MAHVSSPAEVEQYLRGISFPADKEDLLTHARDAGAPSDVIDTLEQLPSDTYKSVTDVSRGVSEIET